MSAPEGQMIGKHYVAPGLGQYINQLGQGYMAGQQQGGVDEQMRDMNSRQARNLQDLRRRRMGAGAGSMPSTGMNTENYGFEMPGAGY
jgi:hypothetical protein